MRWRDAESLMLRVYSPLHLDRIGIVLALGIPIP
jgi:hypothetical protein